ncbi:MAG: zinc-finger domain of monoamine-oxidase A repressor R1-domain-containing protein [Monoraphidium minutum]|nr:MAG: zinc-finger domain of monoamine-oxidase A repressor R1-domain-containing protein [Monoraphidium minutum]
MSMGLQSLTAGASTAPSPLVKIEIERLKRMEENRRRMEEMGVLETARNLMATINASKPPRPQKARKPKGIRPRPDTARRSARLVGDAPKYGEIKGDLDEAVTYSDYEGGLDDLLAGGEEDISKWEPAKQEQFQEIRCNSLGRGSMYDQVVGITCHFCRQKKLCGEEGCPRCSRRNGSADCIGKTECARCQSATGRICRACLLLRYGETMEDVQKQMAAGTWLCPHCYEEEHPHEGWMCNSSICMKRRGYKPTGIAIYDAQQRGFKSVAHWLQAQLKRRGEAALTEGGDDGACCSEEGGGAAAAAEAPRKRGRPRKEAPAAEAAAADADAPAAARGGADQDGGRRRTRAAASAATAAPATGAPAAAKGGRGKAAEAPAESADASKKDAPAKGRKKAASPPPAVAAAAKAALAKAGAAAAAAKKGKGADAAAASSREGSSEPFAPSTPAKRSACAVVGGEAGARRALRPRRV